jgi:hypothetical protein
MSVARGFGLNGQALYSNVAKPIEVNLNFIVDSTNNNGLGIRSLKSNGYVRNVFMNTSPATTTFTAVFASGSQTITVNSSALPNLYVGQTVTDSTTSGNITSGTTITAIQASTLTVTLSKVTAGASAASPGDTMAAVFSAGGLNDGYTNPNPAAGYALIQFKNNFNYYLGGFSGFVSPASGSNINVTSGLTSGNPYIIVSVGTTTAAAWQTLGLPLGLTPTVGQSFIATTSSAGTGTGVVQAPKAIGSGITVVDVIGDPNQSIANSAIAQNGGAWLLVRFLAPTNSTTTTLVATAPANNSVVGMNVRFDGSSVTVDGI